MTDVPSVEALDRNLASLSLGTDSASATLSHDLIAFASCGAEGSQEEEMEVKPSRSGETAETEVEIKSPKEMETDPWEPEGGDVSSIPASSLWARSLPFHQKHNGKV